MDNDDLPIGRVLSRREVLALMGVGAGALVFGRMFGERARAQTQTAVPACVVRPEQTEGPYFVDTQLERSDIRVEPSDGSLVDGLPLALTFLLSQVGSAGCTPLEGAMVDVWQCDSVGAYSGVRDNQAGFDHLGKSFLRGHQYSDEEGTARFTTIYPGWYQGRTVHIHFKVRLDTAGGRSYDFTSQLYFDDALSDVVYQQAPYAGRPARGTRNSNDGIYRNGGELLTLSPSRNGEGYAATFDIGLDITA